MPAAEEPHQTLMPTAEPPQLLISGSRAALGPLRRDLLPVYGRWGNDPEVARGLGTDATRLTLEWGFTVLGLYNIDLTVLAWNTPAIRAYAKAGFREIGRRRGAVVSMGRRFDEVHMDAIATEFTGTALAHLVPDGGAPGHTTASA